MKDTYTHPSTLFDVHLNFVCELLSAKAPDLTMTSQIRRARGGSEQLRYSSVMTIMEQMSVKQMDVKIQNEDITGRSGLLKVTAILM